MKKSLGKKDRHNLLCRRRSIDTTYCAPIAPHWRPFVAYCPTIGHAKARRINALGAMRDRVRAYARAVVPTRARAVIVRAREADPYRGESPPSTR